MISLEAGEDERIVPQGSCQFRRRFGLYGRVNSLIDGIVCFLNKRGYGRIGQHIRGESALGEDLAHGSVEHLMVKFHTPDIPGRESKQVGLIQGTDGTVEQAVMVCFYLLLFQGAIFFLSGTAFGASSEESSPPTRKKSLPTA